MSPSDGATFRITPRENGTVVVHVDGTLGYENRQQLKQLVLDALGAGETSGEDRHRLQRVRVHRLERAGSAGQHLAPLP
jgi:hypothetical protein